MAATNPVPDRMTASAVRLLAEQGYQATSFAAVLEAADAPRGSVYHYFPRGKDQLIAAAIDLAGDRSLALTQGFRGLSAVEIVDAFVGVWKAILVRSQFQAGCAVLAVTVSADEPELVERAAVVFRSWTNSLAAALREAGLARKDARELATTLIAACEGATVLCRASKSLSPLVAVASQLRRLTVDATAS